MALKYRPLETPTTIRLLTIHPSAQLETPITCSIIHADLESSPQYEALSYTWGSTDDPQTVYFESDKSSLSVTKNCASGMRRIRKADEPRVLWIDAVCIDQDNLEERNAQVAIMGKIYSEARRVIIDLGEASEDSDIVMETINAFDTKWGQQGTQKQPEVRVLIQMWVLETVRRNRHVLEIFWDRPWFLRVWVLQEAYRAREAIVLCGSKEAPYGALRLLYGNLRRYENTFTAYHRAPVLKLSKNKKFRARDDLLYLLLLAQTCKASLARDRVFALFPLLSDAMEEGLVADVGKHPAQVFTEIAIWLLQNNGLRLLRFQPRTKSTMIGLPSWAPDWTLLNTDKFTTDAAGLGKFSPWTEIVYRTEQSPILKIRGFLIAYAEESDDVVQGVLKRYNHMASPVFSEYLVCAFLGSDSCFLLGSGQIHAGPSAEEYSLLEALHAVPEDANNLLETLRPQLGTLNLYDEVPPAPLVDFHIC